MPNTYTTDWARAQHDADNGHRATVIQGLKDLTRYLETHPGVPVPLTVDIQYSITAGSDRHGYEKANCIAGILGEPVTGDDSSETRRHFGPNVSYMAVYINRDRMAAYNAHMASYIDGRRAAIKDAAAEVLAASKPGRAA
jgi:hypothetical protein